MSFGVSIGDVLAVIKLLRDTVLSLQAASSATSNYATLVNSEIGVLEAVLRDISAKPSLSTDEGIRLAAASCKEALDEFLTMLRKYHGLVGAGATEDVGGSGRDNRERSRLARAGRKLQWGFRMDTEVQRFREKLAPRVACLQLRLLMISLSASESQHVVNENEASPETCGQMQGNSIFPAETSSQSRSSLLALFRSLTDTLGSSMQALLETTRAMWNTQLQILAFLQRLHDNTLSIDTRFTWAQAPLKFEDALGRILPIPSEYNWGKIEAIILDQFQSGPGSSKVKNGEYALFATHDAAQVISKDTPLLPGSSVTMAMVCGKWDSQWNDVCPRFGCDSKSFTTHPSGNMLCTLCGCRFNLSAHYLPRPRHLPSLDFLPRVPQTDGRFRSEETQSFREHLLKIRAERKAFRNISVYLGYEPRYEPDAYPKFGPQSELSLEDYRALVREPLGWKKVRGCSLDELGQVLLAHPENPKRFIELLSDLLQLETGEIVEHLDCLINMGLDSLLAVDMVARVYAAFGVKLPVLIFMTSSPAQDSGGRTLAEIYSAALVSTDC